MFFSFPFSLFGNCATRASIYDALVTTNNGKKGGFWPERGRYPFYFQLTTPPTKIAISDVRKD
jgi:hypothetical protein